MIPSLLCLGDMTSLSRTEVAKRHPIAKGLSSFRDAITSFCANANINQPFDTAQLENNEEFKELLVELIVVLQNLPATSFLSSITSQGTLRNDLRRFIPVVDSDEFEIAWLFPLLDAIVDGAPDTIIWDHTYAALVETTPSPKQLPFLGQTPYLHTTSSFVNSSEHRKHVDAVLKNELDTIYIGVPGFYDAYFGKIEGLERAAAAIFGKCKEGGNPLFSEEEGWTGWPAGAKEREVLDWLTTYVDLLRDMATQEGLTTTANRILITQSGLPLQGSTAERKLDVGFVRNSNTTHWSDVLISGELKSNPSADTASRTWRDLGRYAREVLTTQDTRRFAIGFTLCGSVMRLWEIDRIGAIASSSFDIHKNGLQFTSTLLGFLLMNDAQLGYDPSILNTADGKPYISIERDGKPEKFLLDSLMKRAPCVAGRATTCWKAHKEGDENTPFVIKDSWQYQEREDEGLLLREATERGVVNVARYYYHETVQVDGKVDDVRENVRRGLDVTQSTNFSMMTRFEGSASTSDTAKITRAGRSISRAGSKRSSSRADDTPLPPSKRICSSSPVKGGRSLALQNRVHRRVIIRDYGDPIYKARSRFSLLSAVESCIEGYESLQVKAGLLQGDISTGNLIINTQGEKNPSWPAFLIDLDLAIKEQREGPSGARGMTGTRAFMAIGLLLGEKHSFMHDLESFFWVLFWICIHYDGPALHKVVPRFEKWNYVDMEELAELKKGAVAHEGDFLKMAHEYFTEYYQPLVDWVNRLRKVVFPNGGRWEKESMELYSQMKEVLRSAREDRAVLAE